MNIKLNISALFLAVILAAVVYCLVSCSGGDNRTAQTDTAVAAETVSGETEREKADVPIRDFGGADFAIHDFKQSSQMASFQSAFEFYSEGFNGEIVNDEVFTRNTKIEEQYNIIIKETGTLEPAKDVMNAVLSGDAIYTLCVDRTERLAAYAMQSAFYAFNKLPYLDLDRIWWDQNARDGFSLGDNLYFCTGDYVLFDKQRIYSLFFNKEMTSDFSLGDIYGIVDEGVWTFDKMDTMCHAVNGDLNGDGKIHYNDDRFGLILGSYDCYEGFFYGMGNRMSTKDSEDMPVLCLFTEKAAKSIDLLSTLLNDSDVSIYGQIATENWKLAASPQFIFEEGRGLFYQEVLQVAMLLDTDIDYGIIPLPKYDEAQDTYQTSSQYLLAMGLAVPINNSDLEMTGIILEAISAESHYTTLPAFIETVIKTKKAPDERAPHMCELLFAGINYDIAAMFNWGGYHSLIADTIPRGSGDTLASAYSAREEKALAEMQKTIETYLAINSDS